MNKVLKAFLLSLAFASMSWCEQVYFTAHGKTYHKIVHWSHAKVVYHAERSEAEKHGLHPCAVCYRVHKTTDTDLWAAPVKEN